MFGVVQNDDDVLDENVQTYAETLSDVCLGVVTIRDFSFFLKRKPHLGLPLLCLKRAKMPNILNRVHNTFSYTNKNNENWNSHLYKMASNILIKNKTPDKLQFNRLTNIAFRCESSRLALFLHNLADTPDNNGVVLVSTSIKKNVSQD